MTYDRFEAKIDELLALQRPTAPAVDRLELPEQITSNAATGATT